jgi:Hemerythrin HHE cation binding domain
MGRRCRRTRSPRSAVQHDIEEHKQLETIMKELESADADGEGFVLLIDELADVLPDHVQDEEQEQFPRLRTQIPQDELVEIASKVETAKKMAPTRPHPSAPNAELFHKMVGPGVGMIDTDSVTSSPDAVPEAGPPVGGELVRRNGWPGAWSR